MISLLKTGLEDRVASLLDEANIMVNGKNTWDIQIHNEGTFSRVIEHGLLGLGEAYMDGWWEAPRLDEFIFKALCKGLDLRVSQVNTITDALYHRLINLQTRRLAYANSQFHYDIGRELYQAMLGPTMIYSCAFWKDATSLDEAQLAKLELVANKLQLQPGMRVLDIGCGWGSMARYLAEQYGVSVTGITTSVDQADYARAACADLPVDIRLCDYRELSDGAGCYDRIVSVGMFEHVGHRNYRIYMEIARRLLKQDGLMLLHTIGRNASGYVGDPWIRKYIFPNGMTPSATQLCESCEDLFVIEDIQNIGAHYDQTLMHWFANFHQAWEGLSQRYDERFYRMWKYYLLSCAALFRARRLQVWQVVLSPFGVPGGYHRPHRGEASGCQPKGSDHGFSEPEPCGADDAELDI